MKKSEIVQNISNEEMSEFVKTNVNDTFYTFKDVRKHFRFKDTTKAAIDIFLEDKSNNKTFVMSVFFREDEISTSTTYGNSFMTPVFLSLKQNYQKFLNAKFGTLEENEALTH